MDEQDLYEILGVHPSATERDITKAYRKLALRLYPDKKGGDADKFHALHEAYTTLCDPKLRAAYDIKHRARVQRQKERAKLDARFRTMREDLERAEAAHANKDQARRERAQADDEEKERLRAELLSVRRDMEEQRGSQRKRARAAASASGAARSSTDDTRGNVTVRAKWAEKAALDEEALRNALGAFGPIDTIIVAPSGHSALCEFTTSAAAENAVEASAMGDKRLPAGLRLSFPFAATSGARGSAADPQSVPARPAFAAGASAGGVGASAPPARPVFAAGARATGLAPAFAARARAPPQAAPARPAFAAGVAFGAGRAPAFRADTTQAAPNEGTSG